MAEYTNKIDEGSIVQAQKEVEASKPPTMEQRQQKMEQRLSEKPFFSFVQEMAKAEKSDMQKFLTKEGVDGIDKIAELYDQKIEPVLGKFEDFFQKQFITELKIVPEKVGGKALEAIKINLVKEAAKDPEAFAEKYQEKFERFEYLTAEADRIDTELKARYKTEDINEMKAQHTQTESVADAYDKALVDNEATHSGAVNDIRSKSIFSRAGVANRWSAFLNTVGTFGKERRSDVEIGETGKYQASQGELSKRVEELRADVFKHGIKLENKERFTKHVADAKNELLDALGPMSDVRKMLMEAAKQKITDKGRYNTDAAANAVGEFSERWEDESGFDTKKEHREHQKEVKELFAKILEREVKDQAASANETVNASRLQEFSTFLSSHIRSAESKDVASKAIKTTLKTTDPYSAKAAHLALMLNKVNGLVI